MFKEKVNARTDRQTHTQRTTDHDISSLASGAKNPCIAWAISMNRLQKPSIFPIPTCFKHQPQDKSFNPLPHMPSLGSSNSPVNKNMMLKI